MALLSQSQIRIAYFLRKFSISFCFSLREREREGGGEGREVGQMVVLSSDIGKSDLIFLFIYFLLSQLFI